MTVPNPGRERDRHARRRSSFGLFLIAALILCTVLAGGTLWLARGQHTTHANTTPAADAVPVTVAEAIRRDVPIYLAGLGTVQAFNTTAIHTQVDGTLQSVKFVEGQEVHKGDVLAQIDTRVYRAALDQAKAKKGEDEAQLVSARKDLERDQALVAKSFETKQNLDHQVALVGQTDATIEADQAAIESAQTQLDFTTIAAPTDGRIGIRQVDPGNIVHAIDPAPITILTQIRPISIVFSLPESNLSEVRRAMAYGPVPVLAYDQDDARPLGTGRLLLVDNEIDQSTSTIRLKATFPNDDEILWPGEFVHVRVLIDTRKDAITVPSVAVQRGPQGLFAWIVHHDKTVEAHPIDSGPTQRDVTIITNGISAGDQVVVNGQYRLEPGLHVDANPAPAAVAKGAAS